MVNTNNSVILPLLHDLEDVPKDYISQVSKVKRVLERWTSDPEFELAFENDPVEAIASLDLDVTPEEIIPLIRNAEAAELSKAYQAEQYDKFPLSTFRYRAYINEKLEHRRQIRRDSSPDDERIAIWRDRQIKRCANELGFAKSDAIVHPPIAVELSKGCTVGCWFCGISAPKFDHNWHYTKENEILWKDVLKVVKNVLGSSARTGFLYWATDPMDNLDYEKYLKDFYTITGRCPQTTTALGIKDIERTRKLLDYVRYMDNQIDRFSVLSLKMLKTIHASFTPEELIRVECIPQNREAKKRQLKSNSGRARLYAEKKAAELTQGEQGDTIACVSGFLLNMPDLEIKLITPCQSTEAWPLGYWVIAKENFKTADELAMIMEDMIEKHMKSKLELDDIVRLRKDLKWSTAESTFTLASKHLATTFHHHYNPDFLMTLLSSGDLSLGEIGLKRFHEDGVPMEETFFLINDLFLGGFTSEDPKDIPQLEQLVESATI